LFADHYSPARLFYRSLTEIEQAHVASAFVFELSKVELEQVPARMVGNLRNVDESLAKRIAAGLGIDLPKRAKPAREPIDLDASPALSIQKSMKVTLQGRVVGILYADGSSGEDIKRLIKSIEALGGHVIKVAPRIGGAELADGSILKADGQLAGTPSQTMDAVAIVLSQSGCAKLLKDSAAVQFVMDAFGHLKAIGANTEAKPLLDKAGVVPDAGVTGLDKPFVDAASRRFFEREPNVRVLA
jgi:catalase